MPNLVKSLKKLFEDGLYLESRFITSSLTENHKCSLQRLIKAMTNVYDCEINQLLFFINLTGFLVRN